MKISEVTPPTAGTVLRGSLTAFRGKLVLASALFCGHQAGEALVPILVGLVIDHAVGTQDPAALATWLVVLGLDFLFLSTCYRFGARCAWSADVEADARLRTQVAERLLDCRGGGEVGRLPGELSNIAVGDAKRVAIVNFMLPMGIAAFVAVVVSAVALLSISTPLGLLIVLGTPPLLWLVQRAGKPLERRSRAEQERAARASGVAADLISGIRVLKGLGAEPAASLRYRDVNRRAFEATLRATRAEAGVFGAVRLTNGLFLALIALVGGLLAVRGQLSVGGLISAVGSAQFLVGPLEMFGVVSAQLAQGRASAARIAEVLATPHPVGRGEGGRPPTHVGPLVLSAVQAEGLGDLDLEVPAGQLVAIVTDEATYSRGLLRVLARDVEPGTGEFRLSGIALADLSPDEVRRGLLVAAHDAHLFAGSIRENVAAGEETGLAPEVAMAAAQADAVTGALAGGAETTITARGSSLSGGQRQRIALARALAADPPVLVLHEPTTAVDSVTEARIAEGIRAVRAGRTTVIITTSPALLSVADRAVLVSGGKITADGPHEELLAHPDYRKLVTG